VVAADDATETAAEPTKSAAQAATNSARGTAETAAQATIHHQLTGRLDRTHTLSLIDSLLHLLSALSR
jgi:hypothetical protein